MGKIKKLLSLFTAVVVAASIALSNGVASAINDPNTIKDHIQNLPISYEDEDLNKPLKDHDGWLSLFSHVLSQVDATEADVKTTEGYQSQHWADYIARPDGFRAQANNEEANLRAMLTNFGHNDGYFESGWRVKPDFKLLPDWGAIIFQCHHRGGQQDSPILDLRYSDSKFLNKINEIYNLDPVANAKKYDALCLKAILRAIIEYDKSLGVEHGGGATAPIGESFLEAFVAHGWQPELLRLIVNCEDMKGEFGVDEDFSLGNRAPRRNAVEDYKKIATRLIYLWYYSNPSSGKRSYAGKDYKIVFGDDGYVIRIEPLRGAQNENGGNGDPSPGLITLNQQNKGGGAGGGGGGAGGPDPKSILKGYTIKRTGSGVDHFAASLVALAISVSGVAGLGYVVSHKKRKNAK